MNIINKKNKILILVISLNSLFLLSMERKDNKRKIQQLDNTHLTHIVSKQKTEEGYVIIAKIEDDSKIKLLSDIPRELQNIILAYLNDWVEFSKANTSYSSHKISFSINSRFLLTNNKRNSVNIRDITDNCNAVKNFTHNKILNAIYSHDAKYIISSSSDSIQIRESDTGKMVYKITDKICWSSNTIEISKDNEKLFFLGFSKIYIYDIKNNKTANFNGNYPIAFSSDGKLVACQRSKTLDEVFSQEAKDVIDIIDLNTLSTLKSFSDNRISYIIFSPDGLSIAYFTVLDRGIKIYNIKSEKVEKVLTSDITPHLGVFEDKYTDIMNTIKYSPDGKSIVSGARDYKIKIWDVQKGDYKELINDAKERIESIDCSKDGIFIAATFGKNIIVFKNQAKELANIF